MIVLAASCIGLFVYLLVGVVVGRPVRMHRWHRPRSESGRHQQWLAQAGIAATPAQFWGGSIAAGGVAFVVGYVGTGAPLVAVVPALAVATLPRAFFAHRRVTRLRAIQAAWPDGLRDVVASISAGRSLTAAVGELATTGPVALRDAFARFPSVARMLGTAPRSSWSRRHSPTRRATASIEVLILVSERGGQIVKETS